MYFKAQVIYEQVRTQNGLHVQSAVPFPGSSLTLASVSGTG